MLDSAYYEGAGEGETNRNSFDSLTFIFGLFIRVFVVLMMHGSLEGLVCCIYIEYRGDFLAPKASNHSVEYSIYIYIRLHLYTSIYTHPSTSIYIYTHLDHLMCSSVRTNSDKAGQNGSTCRGCLRKRNCTVQSRKEKKKKNRADLSSSPHSSSSSSFSHFQIPKTTSTTFLHFDSIFFFCSLRYTDNHRWFSYRRRQSAILKTYLDTLS